MATSLVTNLGYELAKIWTGGNLLDYAPIDSAIPAHNEAIIKVY